MDAARRRRRREEERRAPALAALRVRLWERVADPVVRQSPAVKELHRVRAVGTKGTGV